MMQIVFLFICCVLLAGCAGHTFSWHSPYRDVTALREGDILHVPTGVLVDKAQLFDCLEGARVVYAGETHDNIHAHAMQLEILKAMNDRYPGQVAVGMEMLKRSSQDMADAWSSGTLEEKVWVKTWVHDWTNDFQYYRDILFFIREHHIPLVALRASDDWVAQVKGTSVEHEDGVIEATKKEPMEGPTEASVTPLPDMDLDDLYHRSQIEAVFQAHPMTTNSFEDFYRMQVLRDESMAQSVVDFLTSDRGQDKKMVVLAGVQHVEHGFGIPRRVFRRLAVPYTIVVPYTLAGPEDNKPRTLGVTLPEVPFFPGDFAWVVTHKDLKDEKVMLGVVIDGTDDGIRIRRVTKESAAEKAGLQKDDVIVAFDGEKMETPFDLTFMIGKKKPGDEALVEVIRSEERISFEVTFEKAHMPSMR